MVTRDPPYLVSLTWLVIGSVCSPTLSCIANLVSYRQCVFKKSLKILKGGNQNLYIKEKQTTHWPKEKVQKDTQRSTKQSNLLFEI